MDSTDTAGTPAGTGSGCASCDRRAPGWDWTARLAGRYYAWPSGHEGETSAAAHLLEHWLSESSDDGEAANGDGIRWRLALTEGRAPKPELSNGPPPRHRLPWTPLPTPAEVTEYGRYPEVFVEAGAAGRRYPVEVRRVVSPVDDSDDSNDRPATRQVIEQLLTFLVARHGESQHGELDQRSQLLVRKLGGELTWWVEDVLRVVVAAEPGGTPLDNELHLLLRMFDGKTVRLAVAGPAPAPVGVPPDPICLAAGHAAPVPAGDIEDAGFGARFAATATLLSSFLPVNNNDTVTFTVTVARHGLNLSDANQSAADTDFRTWWERSASALLPDEDWGTDSDRTLYLLDPDAMAVLLRTFELDTVQVALFMDDHDGDFEKVEPVPAEHLAGWLIRDLVGLVTRLVTGATDQQPILSYEKDWADTISSGGAAYRGLLALVGPEQVAVITMDVPC